MPAFNVVFPDPDEPSRLRTGPSGPDAVGSVPTASSELPDVETVKLHAPDDDAAAARRSLQSLQNLEPDVLPVIPEEEREAVGELSLLAYYEQRLSGWRHAQVESQTISDGWQRMEQTHLRAFSKWDLSQPPPGWPASIRWTGTPLSLLVNGKRFKDFFSSAVTEGNAGTKNRDPWALDTAKTCWKSLCGLMKSAHRQQVISTVPELKNLSRHMQSLLEPEKVRTKVYTYTEEELGELYAAIPGVVMAAAQGDAPLIKAENTRKLKRLVKAITIEMQTALVLGANAGPRTADLFRMHYVKEIRDLHGEQPVLVYTASKTKKVHTIPLAPVTVQHLKKLQRFHTTLKDLESPLFPNLSTITAKRPTQSEPHRRCCTLLKSALDEIELSLKDFHKPWQALRKTCTTRFNAHGMTAGLGMVGKLITHGPDSDTSSKYYDNSLPTITKAVGTIGWPEQFSH